MRGVWFPLQVDIPEAKLPVEDIWRISVQAECLAAWLEVVGECAYKVLLADIGACKDDLSQRRPIANALLTLIKFGKLPAKVLKEASAVFGRQVEFGDLVSLYKGVTQQQPDTLVPQLQQLHNESQQHEQEQDVIWF